MWPTAKDSLTFDLKIEVKVKGQGHSEYEKLSSFYTSFVLYQILNIFASSICTLKTISEISFLSPKVDPSKS